MRTNIRKILRNLQPRTWNLEPGIWNLQLGTWNFQLEKIKPVLLIAILLSVLSGCEEDPPVPPEPTPAKIALEFRHLVEGEPLQLDTICYKNAAGNDYLVTELQYFISDSCYTSKHRL